MLFLQNVFSTLIVRFCFLAKNQKFLKLEELENMMKFCRCRVDCCRYDPETEELLRENLIAKVISVQQMFEKPESTPKMNSCTKKRKAAIMNMAQITSILKMMAEARPTKKKRKKHKVSVAPPPKVEKPKLIPLEGYLNLSSLLPKVDMKKMQTRSFRWSRERMTSLIEDYVNSDHIKENAKLEHLHGIKPVLLKLGGRNSLRVIFPPK